MFQGLQVGFGGNTFPGGAADYFNQGFGLGFREAGILQVFYGPVRVKNKSRH